MAHLSKIDLRRGLTPWSLQEHADFVAGQYGSMLATNPEKAAAYVQGYKQKEKDFLLAYAEQKEFIKNSGVSLGAAHQELPDPVMLNWDPTKLFAHEPQAMKKKGLFK